MSAATVGASNGRAFSSLPACQPGMPLGITSGGAKVSWTERWLSDVADTPSEPTAPEPAGDATEMRPVTIRCGDVWSAVCAPSTTLTEPVSPMHCGPNGPTKQLLVPSLLPLPASATS